MKKIKLTKGKHVLVDDEDFEWLNQWKWYYNNSGYAMRDSGGRKNKVRIIMHRLLAQTPENMDTDHINGNKLDNRKSNLRVVTTAENMRNTKHHFDTKSGLKGVYFSNEKKKKKWYSRIMINGEDHHLGYFLTKEECLRAYNQASIKYHGEFGRRDYVK